MKISTRLRRLRRPRLLHTYALIIVLVFSLAGYLYENGDHAATVGRLVTFHDRGKDRVILTHASSVREALNDADISVDAKDDVEPAINSQLLTTDSAVIIYRARMVLVIDGALRQKVLTPAQSPNEIAVATGITPISDKDKTTFREGNFVSDGAGTVLTIKRTAVAPIVQPIVFKPGPHSLSKSKGAQLYTDGSGVTHRETYYDLHMNIVIGACGIGGYTIRSDGAKIDKDGYVLVAASYRVYPRCSVVDTSMGPGKVYDTGGFVARYPHGFDLATDWTNYDGR